MSQIFSAVEKLKDKFKIRLDKVYIENRIFRLFSTVTVSCLFLCCGLVTMQQLIGKHIECILPPKEDVRQEALNQYCFIMSTYTLPHLYNQTIGTEVSHFGVGRHDPTTDKQKYHSYYQWVPFVLFFQGLLFLLPHFIWKSYEGGRIKAYCDLELADKIPMKSRSINLYNTDKKSKDPDKMINRASQYFVDNMTYNTWFASVYIICELLNFAIVVSNIFLTDAFLGYEFSKYGHEVINFLSYDPENRIDPMDRVFPKVTKCDFQKYGPSGNIIRYDIMCVLALNIINEKIYVFLWFWFIILSIFGGLNVIYRIAALVLPGLRSFTIGKKIPKQHEGDLEYILTGLSYSDWFILKRISDNINRIRFGELCQGIRKVMPGSNVTERLSTPQSYSRDDFEDSGKLLDPEG